MDAQILLSIGRTFASYVAEKEILPRLDNLFHAIDAYIGAPNNENLQRVTEGVDDVTSALDVQLVERMPRTWISIAEQLGVLDVSGYALRDRIHGVFRQNQVTFDVVRSEVKEIRKQVADLSESFNNLDNVLHSLGLSPYTLDGEEGEISYFIPRDVSELTPGDFAAECKELLFIYRTVAELVTGQVEDPTIRKISTTEPLIVITSSYAVVRGVLKLVDQILEMYKKVQEARLIKAQADKAQFEAIAAAAETQAKTAIEQGIAEIVEGLMVQHQSIEGGGRSRPELRGFVERAVNELAARLDNGYRIEADVSPATRALKTGPNAQDAESEDFRISIEAVQKRIRYVQFEGEPILNLPPPDNDE